VRPGYIFSAVCVEIFIFTSLLGSRHLPLGCTRCTSASWIPATVPRLSLSPDQYQLCWRRGGVISKVARVADAGEDASRIGPGASTSAANAPNHRNALPRILKQALLFDPNSIDLTSESQKSLTLEATWLQKHPEVRIFVVGYCDPLGSEECTHDLAEGRAVGVRQDLAKSGVRTSQIVAARGWEKAAPVCEAATPTCQAMNRRARIFIAESACAH